MSLSERKRAILTAIIRAYVETGEPIGSKALCGILDSSLSSATLRNEMSDLCELGYLEQPHTSAGRVPTVTGYKFYINDLMHRNSPSGEMKLIIDSMLDGLSGEIGDITARAGQILSELTGLPAISSRVANDTDTVKRIELLPMGKHLVLAVLITSHGIIKNKICRFSGNGPSTTEKFYNLCGAYIIGRKLSELTPTYSQQLMSVSGDLSLMSLVAGVFDMLDEVKRSNLSVKGESNFFRLGGAGGQVQRVMELIAQKDIMLSLINSVREPVGVLFGGDTEIAELRPATIVIAGYGINGHELGKIGVIGPTRMSYDSVIPSLEYFADKMSKVISRTLTDLED